MPKKIKDTKDHLQAIEYLLAGILLKRDVNVKDIAKIIGCSDNALTKLYPQKGRKSSKNK